MTSEPSRDFAFVWPLWARLMEAALAFVIWGVVPWVAAIAALQSWLLPDWTPPRRGALAAALAVPIAIAAAWRSYFGKPFAVIVGRGRIELRRGGTGDELLATDVLALIGRGGISLDGGALVAWTALAIVTEGRTYALRFNPQVHRDLYRALRRACPRAWGLPFGGRLEPPELAPDGAGLDRLRRDYGGRVVRDLAWALVVAAGSVAAPALAVGSLDPRALLDSKGAPWLIVVPFLAAELFRTALRDLRLYRQVRRAARALGEAIDPP